MTQTITTPDILYDHVLGEIEAGRDAAALLLLAGMLDAAETDPKRAEQWRGALVAHALYKFITQCSARGTAMASFGFSRGLIARVELGRNAIESAWQRGRQILLLQCGDDGELDGLLGLERNNIAFEARAITSAASKFDLIVASGIADQLAGDGFRNFIAHAANRLNVGGTLIVSSFVPGYLGNGLRQICAKQTLFCHDEISLAEAATAAGLGISTFRDASNCLIWAELRVANDTACRRAQIPGDHE